MAQKDRIVGLDISKLKVDGCIRSLEMRLEAPSTAEGHAQLVSWLGANGVGLAVMEASGGYERSWARALSAAGIAVWIGSSVNLVLIAAFVWYIDRFQIAAEEEALAEIFGNRYVTYRGKVRRWL